MARNVTTKRHVNTNMRHAVTVCNVRIVIVHSAISCRADMALSAIAKHRACTRTKLLFISSSSPTHPTSFFGVLDKLKIEFLSSNYSLTRVSEPTSSPLSSSCLLPHLLISTASGLALVLSQSYVDGDLVFATGSRTILLVVLDVY